MSPVSTANSRVVYAALKACSVGLMSPLPETWPTEGGGVTEDVPRPMRLPFSRRDGPERVAPRTAKAQTLARSPTNRGRGSAAT